MPRQSESTLAAIKAAVDIVALVGEYLTLHRAGSKFKALCPFHDDHNPSLELNPERQSYKCWSCGAGGDVFDFVAGYERVEFAEALRMLADRAGVPLADSRGPGHGPEAGPTKADLFAANAWAEETFVAALAGSREARSYVESRGLSAASVDRFRLGFAPDDRDWLAAEGRRRGFSAAVLEKAGLLARSSEPPHALRPRFRGRLIFPIHDPRGRTLGFGGRVLPSVEKTLAGLGRNVAKYLNSPETLLFQKRRVLYAADLARPAAREAGWVAVVEGYTDVIAAHQVGLGNVVGTLGTALGDDHVLALRRLADRVVLVFDGDEAGQKAADRSLELFLGHEVDVRVLTLPAGIDPCDFLLAEGPEPFRAMVERAVDPLEYAIARASARFDLASAEGSRQAAEWVLAIFGRVPRRAGSGLELKLAKALDTLARRLGVPLAELGRRLDAVRRSHARRAANPHASAADAGSAEAPNPDIVGAVRMDGPPPAPIRAADLDPIDRELVEIALNEPGAVEVLAVRVPAGSLRDAPLRTILQACYDLRREGHPPTFERVSLRLDDPSVRSLAAGLLLPIDPAPMPTHGPGTGPAPWGDRLAGLLARHDGRIRDERLRDLRAAINETDASAHPGEHAALLREYFQLLHQRPDTKAKHAS